MLPTRQRQSHAYGEFKTSTRSAVQAWHDNATYVLAISATCYIPWRAERVSSSTTVTNLLRSPCPSSTRDLTSPSRNLILSPLSLLRLTALWYILQCLQTRPSGLRRSGESPRLTPLNVQTRGRSSRKLLLILTHASCGGDHIYREAEKAAHVERNMSRSSHDDVLRV